MSNLLKTSYQKKWTLDFVANKLVILLVLCRKVVIKRDSQKKSGAVGHHTQLRAKLRQMFTALHEKYLKCKLLYAENQCQEVNRQEQTPTLIVEVGCNLVAGIVRMGKEERHKINGISTDNLHSCTIAGTTMWEEASRPAIEGCLGSFGHLFHIPFFEVLLTVPDEVTGGASSMRMRLTTPRLRKLALEEAQLCTNLHPQINRVNRAKGRHDKADGLIVECCCGSLPLLRSPKLPPP